MVSWVIGVRVENTHVTFLHLFSLNPGFFVFPWFPKVDFSGNLMILFSEREANLGLK